MSDAPAPVVAGDGESIEAQRAHHFDLIEGHRTWRIVDMTLATRRFAGIAVTAPIGQYDRELLGPGGSDLMPHRVSLWMSVQ